MALKKEWIHGDAPSNVEEIFVQIGYIMRHACDDEKYGLFQDLKLVDESAWERAWIARYDAECMRYRQEETRRKQATAKQDQA